MNLFTKLFGSKKDYYEENTWKGMNELGHAFSGKGYSKTSGLQQYEKSLYVFRAVSIIADRVSSVGWDLQKIKNTKGEIEVLNNHPLYSLLMRPNPDQTYTKLMKILVMHLELAGEGFWYKLRDGRGNVIELLPLQTQHVTKVISKETGKIVAVDLHLNGVTTKIPFDDIIYFNHPSPLDMFNGQSSIMAVRSRIETEKEASLYQANFFKNNAQPNSILRTDEKLTDDQKNYVKKAWKQAFGGSRNAGKTALLEYGLDYRPLAISQREMDFIESMRFTREDILIAFGVPKGVLLSEDSNNADGKNAMRSFLENKIEPLVKMIVETINIQLIETDFGNDLMIKYQNPVPDDRKELVSEIEKLVDVVITRNEYREKLGLDAVDGGDILFNSFTKQPLKVSAQDPKDEKLFRGKEKLFMELEMQEKVKEFVKNYKKTKKKKKKVEYSSLFDKKERGIFKKLSLKRMGNHEKNFANQIDDFAKEREKIALEKLKNEKKEIDPDKVIDEKEQRESWELFMLPAMLSIANDLGQDATNLITDGVKYEMSKKTKQEIEKGVGKSVESITETTNKALKETLAEGIKAGEGIDELGDRVSEIYAEFPQYRSDMIARTETTHLNATSSLDAYKQNGVEAKEWIATHDGNTRENHMALDGEITSIKKTFSDGSMHPPKHDDPYNCRCLIAPAIKM